MTEQSSRRGFLRGLTTLPLIGGGMTLIGNPVRAAVPVTDEMLRRYANWCGSEYRETWAEIHARSLMDKHPGRFTHDYLLSLCRDCTNLAHLKAEPSVVAALPSTRTAIVLSAVGCDWTGRRA